MRKRPEIIFEDALSDSWSGSEVREVPLNERPLTYIGLIALVLGLTVVGRVAFLGVARAEFYTRRAELNSGKYEFLLAPRGIITDRFGQVLADNKPSFSAVLDVKEFLHNPDLQAETVRAAEEILGIPADYLWQIVQAKNLERGAEPVPLDVDLNHSRLVALKSLNLPTLKVVSRFQRYYPEGKVFSSVLGYVGLTTPDDLKTDPELSGDDFVGKAGVETFYDQELRGSPGWEVKLRDAHGEILDEKETIPPQIGQTLKLTLDAGLQKYFYERMTQGLLSLGRDSGAGLALNPQTGEVLALINFPVYDANIFSTPGKSGERRGVLDDSRRPLFNRTISGLYS
ncbi:MAG: hypothetical protein AAB686_00090, partial [Patescibacteria group bacterium]